MQYSSGIHNSNTRVFVDSNNQLHGKGYNEVIAIQSEGIVCFVFPISNESLYQVPIHSSVFFTGNRCFCCYEETELNKTLIASHAAFLMVVSVESTISIPVPFCKTCAEHDRKAFVTKILRICCVPVAFIAVLCAFGLPYLPIGAFFPLLFSSGWILPFLLIKLPKLKLPHSRCGDAVFIEKKRFFSAFEVENMNLVFRNLQSAEHFAELNQQEVSTNKENLLKTAFRNHPICSTIFLFGCVLNMIYWYFMFQEFIKKY